MSLLLDALKRAEQEKQSRGVKPAGASASPAAANLELQPIASAAAPASGPARPEAATSSLRAANLPGSSRRTWLWIAAAAGVLLVIAGAGYVWYAVTALSPRPGLALRAQPPKPTAPAASIPLPPPSASAAAPVPSDTSTKATAAEPNVASTRATPKSSGEREELRAPRVAPVPATQPPLRRARPEETAVVPADVASGYTALRNGDLGAARKHYASALSADGTNVDALVGLATVEARSGNRSVALGLYRSVLEVDPRNGTALAGIAALIDMPGNETVEARLREEIARDPKRAALHFQLGNLHATAGRWMQAQAAFFEAYRLEPGNADILHNLAVSLDHAAQPKLAADFYRQALNAAPQGALFDRAAVARRLAELDARR